MDTGMWVGFEIVLMGGCYNLSRGYGGRYDLCPKCRDSFQKWLDELKENK